MLHEAAPSGIANTVPQRRAGKQEATGDPPPTGGSIRPVPFDRLLSVAALTPAQASLVAVRLLDAAHLSGTVDRERRPAGTDLGAVTFTASGDVAVGRAGTGGSTCVTELLEQLLQNARRLPAHPRQAQLVLLHRLEEATRDPQVEPAARARELEGALVDTLGPGAPQRLAGELAALVAAFARMTPGVPDPADARAAPAQVGPATAAAAIAGPRSAPNRPPRRSNVLFHPRQRGRRVAILVLVVAAVLAGSGYVMVGGPVAGIVGSLGGDRNPTAPATPAPAHPSTGSAAQQRPNRAEAVAALAGRHSGTITGVVVQKAGSCSPGALCPVKVTVHLRASSSSRPIGWKVGAARLCKRGIAWSAPTTVTALAGWTTVYASSSVRVPRGRSLALVALTTTPARAQSRPVPVTGSLSC